MNLDAITHAAKKILDMKGHAGEGLYFRPTDTCSYSYVASKAGSILVNAHIAAKNYRELENVLRDLIEADERGDSLRWQEIREAAIRLLRGEGGPDAQEIPAPVEIAGHKGP